MSAIPTSNLKAGLGSLDSKSMKRLGARGLFLYLQEAPETGLGALQDLKNLAFKNEGKKQKVAK